ncbi:MAG: hypothetical protein ABIL70_04860 [candidate division WOR-3 bacterium]
MCGQKFKRLFFIILLLALWLDCHKQKITKTWDDLYPVWSPDGRYIAFFRNFNFGIDPPYIVDTLSGIRILNWPTLVVLDSFVKHIAFDWMSNGEELLCGGLSIINVKTKYVKEIKPEGDSCLGYAWANLSPDGARILYVCWAPDSNWISMTDTLGSYAKKLFHSAWAPAWHPSGNSFIFISNSNNQYHVCVGDTAGNIIRVLGIDIGAWGLYNGYVSFSPDGSKIVYSRVQLPSGGLNNYEIHLCDSLGENDIKLTSGCQPYWSPDGDKIVFARWSEEDSLFSLWVINTDGTNIIKITE